MQEIKKQLDALVAPFDMGQLKDIINMIEEKVDPESAGHHYLMGIALGRMKDEAAVDSLNRALKLVNSPAEDRMKREILLELQSIGNQIKSNQVILSSGDHLIELYRTNKKWPLYFEQI